MKNIILPAILVMSFAVSAFPAFASDNLNTTTVMTKDQKIAAAQAKKATSAACVITAINKRDTALISAFNAYDTSIVGAFQARLTALKAAWGISNVADRMAAVNTAWDAFTKAKRSAQIKWHTTQKQTWGTFISDARACGLRGGNNQNHNNGLGSLEVDNGL